MPNTAIRLEAMQMAFEAQNQQDLKRIANDSIKDAAMEDSQELAGIAVVAYSLYKILSKDHFVNNPAWPRVNAAIIGALKKSIFALARGSKKEYEKNMASVALEIRGIDDRLSNYAQNIFEKGKIKQASTAYALGLSIGQAAWLTGAQRKALQEYIGQTRIHDEQPPAKGIARRLEELRKGLK
ncbi:MAG: hypothetical protein NUV67_02040 [archaeon]|nr:hypothetical protein [archaeon]